MKWFRLWTDILDDVKILQLTDYEYRIWISLLCYACDVNSMYGECRINVTSMSIRFRTRVSHLKHAIETFQKLDLITISEDGFVNITNWNKRQFKSDNAYDRVVKYRESKQDMKRFNPVTRNVSETVPDTDTDTDTDKRIIKRTFVVPSIDDVTAYCSERGNYVDAEKWHNYYSSNGWRVGKNPMKDWKAAVRTWEKSDFNKQKQANLDEWSMK